MISVTGGHGFLGWHLRAAALAAGIPTTAIALGDGFDLARASHGIAASDRVIHLAGVNRGDDDEVRSGNRLMAEQLIAALEGASSVPSVLVYANSTQAGNGTVYGETKADAGQLLRRWCADRGVMFVDVLLPNLFGEHGRPHYNSVTATFCSLLAKGESPSVVADKQLTMLHAQDAADVLLLADVEHPALPSFGLSVSELLDRLRSISSVYRTGEIPALSSNLDIDLFNTYRSFLTEELRPIAHRRHVDARGDFVEVIRSHGGTGQASYSTTVPGITRGDHFHRRKVERFTVIDGTARISLRRVLTDKIVDVVVSGEDPVSIDMPALWSHSITNIGDSTLRTLFWTNDIFDPDHPDTYAEAVR
ncbi:MAG: NAD-dependent epimerase/dehydratase family protein [Microcella sp.]|uniref:polysaccharide biosynthesis C-terminal domain-containing protein n=1 Tax=Microcella sp. TaxID=1913979 RepID=UPI00271B3194|nr:NAD-dependent epimerase/dehydratase family protein [Microcella sp.]MDO8337992.1 NAD-dependent epimerase/dehydratase family protein [Microcella sp.]